MDNKNIAKKNKTNLIMAVLTTIIMFVLLITINATFFYNYYENKRINAMKSAYLDINKASDDEMFVSEEFESDLLASCEKNNVNILVLDNESKSLVSSSSDYEALSRVLMDYVFEADNMNKDRIVEENKRYEIHKVVDPRNNVEYMDMWGILDDGKLFLMRASLEGIRESVRISVRFFDILLLIAFIFIGMIIFWQSRRVYIHELQDINKKLKDDIEQKERIDEMRKEFLSNVSHELKTPIALIQGYAEGLKEGINQDEEADEMYCDVIIDEASKMNSMVKKLLDLNHIEFGDVEFNETKFDIALMIKNYMESVDIICKQKDINVKLELEGPMLVYADEFYVEEILSNYVSNAINYADNNKEIVIKAYATLDKARVSVFNTGENIPQESIDRIWEKFYKVDKARTREYGGNGVGLSIVKALLDRMNGEYGVINYAEGVEFFFTLDLIKDIISNNEN